MTRKLNQSDRQALDLVLDQMGRSDHGDGVIAVGQAPAEPRVQAVGKILSALAAMPATEPPEDLVQRTLDRIEHSAPRQAQQPAPQYLAPGQLPA